MAVAHSYNFNADDFSEFDVAATGTRVSTDVSAGLDSTAAGVARLSGGTAGTLAQDALDNLTGSAVATRIGFYLDLNTLSVDNAASLELLYVVTGSLGALFAVNFIGSATGVTIEWSCDDDAFAVHTVATGDIGSGEHTIEVEIEQAATSVSSDGVITIYVDSSQVDTESGIDNYDVFEDYLTATTTFYLGDAQSGTSSGTAYYDEITIRDDTTPIFIFTGYSLVQGGGQP